MGVVGPSIVDGKKVRAVQQTRNIEGMNVNHVHGTHQFNKPAVYIITREVAAVPCSLYPEAA